MIYMSNVSTKSIVINNYNNTNNITKMYDQ